MQKEAIERQSDATLTPWKRIGAKRVEKHLQEQHPAPNTLDRRIINSVIQLFRPIKIISANIFLSVVHVSTRIANRPLVDLGQKYSVATLNERINTLEEILVKQWTNLKDDDFLTPNEEIKQYIAACHVARQYDRITEEQLAARLGIDYSKAASLIDQLVEDEIITEGYSVTYHDIRRSAIDAAIEQKLNRIQQVSIDKPPTPVSKDKKH